jgi:hypothetical protein
MKIITPGHTYELDSFEKEFPQILQFIHKEREASYEGAVDGKLYTVKDGTTNEEVIEVLINRLEFLNNKSSCIENIFALQKLREALMWLEQRTKIRLKQGVEGRDVPHKVISL